MAATPLLAVIYTGPDGPELLCLDHCRRRGYRVVGISRPDRAGQHWAGVVAMLASGEADLAVIANRADLPPNRLPRVEAVGEEVPAPTALRRPLRRARVR